MKISGVIGAAASGIISRSFHAHFSDVNPVKKQGLTSEDKWMALQSYYIQRDKEKARLRRVTLAGGKLLPVLNPKMR